MPVQITKTICRRRLALQKDMGGPLSGVIVTGQVTAYLVVDPGQYGSAPSAVVAGDGTGATATVRFSGGKVVGLEVNALGSGYTNASVSFTGGSPTVNALAIAIIDAPLSIDTDDETLGDLTLVRRIGFDDPCRGFTGPGAARRGGAHAY